jgi:hypothetical protein
LAGVEAGKRETACGWGCGGAHPAACEAHERLRAAEEVASRRLLAQRGRVADLNDTSGNTDGGAGRRGVRNDGALRLGTCSQSGQRKRNACADRVVKLGMALCNRQGRLLRAAAARAVHALAGPHLKVHAAAQGGLHVRGSQLEGQARPQLERDDVHVKDRARLPREGRLPWHWGSYGYTMQAATGGRLAGCSYICVAWVWLHGCRGRMRGTRGGWYLL